MGMHQAGFDVVGVDIKPQPKYPFKFVQGDALTLPVALTAFDLIWASPPCQGYTKARKLQGNKHPDLVEPVRKMLKDSGVPYIIENVPGSPLIDPVELCGLMFDLKTYRHRLFETSFYVPQPPHTEHTIKQTKMGRPPKDGEFIQVVGHFSGVPFAQKAMGIDWLGQNELREAIPPAYAEYISKYALAQMNKKKPTKKDSLIAELRDDLDNEEFIEHVRSEVEKAGKPYRERLRRDGYNCN